MSNYSAIIAQYKKISKGIIISFRGASLDTQRAYIWNMLANTEYFAVYIDWDARFSKHNPPSMTSNIICVSIFDITRVIAILEELIERLPVQYIIIDPFVDLHDIPVGWIYTAFKNLVRTHKIDMYLLFYPERRIKFQAQVYIDLRR